MKQFLLFTGQTYYACGGWYDFKDSFDTLYEAKNLGISKCKNGLCDWYQVVDSRSGQIVARSSGHAHS